MDAVNEVKRLVEEVKEDFARVVAERDAWKRTAEILSRTLEFREARRDWQVINHAAYAQALKELEKERGGKVGGE